MPQQKRQLCHEPKLSHNVQNNQQFFRWCVCMCKRLHCFAIQYHKHNKKLFEIFDCLMSEPPLHIVQQIQNNYVGNSLCMSVLNYICIIDTVY